MKFKMRKSFTMLYCLVISSAASSFQTSTEPFSSYDESVCFVLDSSPKQSHKPRVSMSALMQIKYQEDFIRRELQYAGLSENEILQTLAAMCPDDRMHPVQAADSYLEKLGFATLTVSEIKSERRSYEDYKRQCARRGLEALSAEDYFDERDALIAGSGHPLADFREGAQGFAHSHGCEGSADSNCKPHHHILTERGRKKAIEVLVHRDVIAYREKRGGLGSSTSTKEGNDSGSVSIGVVSVEVGGSISSSTTQDVVTYEHIVAKEAEFRQKWENASDSDILESLRKEDGNLVGYESNQPEPSTKPEPSTAPSDIGPDPFESASELDLETHSTQAGKLDLTVSCGDPIDYNQHAKTEDPHQIEEDRRKAEEDAQCILFYGMGCDEYNEWVKLQSVIKISTEMEKFMAEKEKENQECYDRFGMTCDEYDWYLSQNIKPTGEEPWHVDVGTCEMNGFYLECGPGSLGSPSEPKIFNP